MMIGDDADDEWGMTMMIMMNADDEWMNDWLNK